jgi:hypothetical protein
VELLVGCAFFGDGYLPPDGLWGWDFLRFLAFEKGFLAHKLFETCDPLPVA